MSERIVDVLEVVEVHQQHCERGVHAPSGLERLVEPLRVQRAIRQPGQGVTVREIHDARLARDETFLHRVEGAGKRSDLVRARHGGDRRIIAGGDAARDACQLAHRPHDAARDHQARDNGNRDCEHGDQRELALQAVERLERGR